MQEKRLRRYQMIKTLKGLILFASVGVCIVICVNYVFRQVEAQKTSRYGEFSHSVKEHRKSCNACHKVPSENWRDAGDYPNITDYPDHASCVGCHRQQFFSGNRPAICTVCHVQASPRGKTRFRFPIRGSMQEFRINFPHDKHQDIIAARENDGLFRTSHNAYAMLRVGYFDDDKEPVFNSCAICHRTMTELPGFADRKPFSTEPLSTPADGGFSPKSQFFKDSPYSHASCFSCHYQGQKPVANDCGSCHVLASSHFESNLISRFSLKFDHESENHSKKDCTNCHIRITQSSDLRSLMGADVPIMTCGGSCHGKEITAEISKRNESIEKKQVIFQCVHCHTPAIGSYSIPASHLGLK